MKKIPLEELAEKEMIEARRLFSMGLAPTARYVLNYAMDMYKHEDKPIPDKFLDLQKKFDEEVKKYPQKIVSCMKSGDYKKAASLFSVFQGYFYNGRSIRCLEMLENQIREGSELQEKRERKEDQ